MLASTTGPCLSLTSQPEQGATRLSRLLRQVYSSKLEILHYNSDENFLSVWSWPLDYAGRRVSPANLADHCTSNGVLWPHCLCPVNTASNSEYPQASFYKETSATHTENYVARCTGSEGRRPCCGYLVPLQRIYTESTGSLYIGKLKEVVPIQVRRLQNQEAQSSAQSSSSRSSGARYIKRRSSQRVKNHLKPFQRLPIGGSPLVAGSSPTSASSTSASSDNSTTTLRAGSEPKGFFKEGNSLKRNYAALNINDEIFTIPELIPPLRIVTETEFLLKLDDYVQPGLYEEEFRELLSRMGKCRCGMIMVRRVFNEHRCRSSLLRPMKRARTDSLVVDLTAGNTDSE